MKRSLRPSAFLAATLGSLLTAGCHDIGAEAPPVTTIEGGTDGAAEADEESAEALDAGDESFDASLDSTAADVSEVESGSVTTVLAGRADSCLDCAAATCALYLHGCDTIPGAAAQGPATGTPRSVLCAKTLDCVLSTQCGAKDVSLCYCGPPTITGNPSDCYQFPASNSGACKTVLEGAAESTQPEAVVSSFSDTSKGVGWALLLLQCLNDNHCGPCFSLE